MSEPSEWATKLAADYWNARYQPGGNMVDILAPMFDAARAEGAAEERARIVAWLVAQLKVDVRSVVNRPALIADLALRIDRNEHAAERGEEKG